MSIVREVSEGREITKGTFDPRTYKEDDPVNWARKRKPEWMETTGKIVFTRYFKSSKLIQCLQNIYRKHSLIDFMHRERTVDREPSPEQSAPAAPAPAEPELVKQPPRVVPVKTNTEMKEIDPYWPRKRRSDITRSRVV